MRKCLFAVLLLPSVAFSAPEMGIDDVYEEMHHLARQIQLADVLSLLNSWASLYPQCYQDVADLLAYTDDINQMYGDYTDFANAYFYSFEQGLMSIDSTLVSILGNQFDQLVYLSNIYDKVYDLHDDVIGLYDCFDRILSRLDQPFSVTFVGLNDFLSSLRSVIEDALQGIIVDASIVGTVPVSIDPTVGGSSDFDYTYLEGQRDFFGRVNTVGFSLESYELLYPDAWLWDTSASYGSIIRHEYGSHGGQTYDLPDFICNLGNVLIRQNQDECRFLSQFLGFVKGDNSDRDQMETKANQVADDAPGELDALRDTFGVSSLQDAADTYFVDLSVDEYMVYDALELGYNTGSSLPEFVTFGPIPFSRIVSSMSDEVLQIPLSGLVPYLDLCRNCFAVIWYLLFLTIAIFLARFSWAIIKPVLSVIGKILQW